MKTTKVKKYVRQSKENDSSLVYWSDVCKDVAQGFFVTGVVTVLVAGEFDAIKVSVIVLSLSLSITFWILGWLIRTW